MLGIDYGSKRIGVAVSDPLRIIATGLTVVNNSPKAVEELVRLGLEYDAECFVVGMPLNLKGERGMKAEEVQGFIDSLREASGKEIVSWDERMTSVSAQNTLIAMGTSKKQRREKGVVDKMAAALILQTYLDRLRAT